MKKLSLRLLVLCLLPLGLQRAWGAASASAAGLGFSMNGNFYQPSDSRYQGIGTGVGINIKFDDSLTMGYRVEEMNVRYDDSVAAVTVNGNFSVITQGITAYYRTLGNDRLGLDVGLWMGSMTTGDFTEAAGADGLTSPFIQPLGRVVYSSAGKVEALLTLGIGYRFVRRFNLASPSGTLAGEAPLRNLDGLDLSFGVGIQF